MVAATKYATLRERYAKGTGPTGTLKSIKGFTVTSNGEVIENVEISGSLRIEADNVVVRNFRLLAGGAPYGIQMTDGAKNVKLQRGEVRDASSALLYGSDFLAESLELHHGGGDAIKAILRATVRQSWIHHLGSNANAHADGNQTRSGGQLFFGDNYFDMPSPGTPEYPGSPWKSNACQIIQAADGPIDGVTFERNIFDGGNYVLYVTSPDNFGMPKNVRIVDNLFGDNYKYGLLNKDGALFESGNRWLETGIAIPDLSAAKKAA